jgi:hypothetical protein
MLPYQTLADGDSVIKKMHNTHTNIYTYMYTYAVGSLKLSWTEINNLKSSMYRHLKNNNIKK